MNNFSIQQKILLSIAGVFLILLLFSTWFTSRNEKAMVQELATEKAQDIASSYFDGINSLMLTGSMNQSEILRQKTLSHDNVEDVRLIRSKSLTDMYGPGTDQQSITDSLDQQAITGSKIIDYSESNVAGRLVTVIEPIVASADFKGTNCLNCHNVEEGTILGAVRVTYSLAKQDKKIFNDAMLTLAINAALFIIGMFLITLLMRKIVITPLAEMRDTMALIKRDSNLGIQLNVHADDEIGQLARTFNSMLGNFSSSLGQVFETINQLTSATDQISSVASQTSDAARQQRSETESVINAIQELENSVHGVRDGANAAAEASIEADQAAASGTEIIKNAIDGIYDLVSEIERAAEVIKRLDEKSNGVGSVLDVIKGLAEQTNLLALNAAIEAARAGEQGRGFAVVADEVRTLATRSHQATEEIEKIIEQLQHEAKDAVKVMNNAKESAEQRSEQVQSADSGLNIIADRVTHIRQINSEMAATADNQNQVAQHVSQCVNNISQLAEQTTQDAEQTNSASENLVMLANQLTKLVNEFKR